MTTAARTRLSPEQRRAQLLELGAELLATRSLDELTIDLLAEEARVSRGLLYHYFGSKQGFHEAVVRWAVDDLVARTAPPKGGGPLDRLAASMAAYVDYVLANHQGYVSIVRAARGGNEALRALHDEARATLTRRVFTDLGDGEPVPDTAAARLAVRGWAAMAEELVLAWADDPAGIPRDDLLAALTGSLPALVDLLH